jgi:phosphatidylethanolamine-binding protein (PEBP) family uncharacterized protein
MNLEVIDFQIDGKIKKDYVCKKQEGLNKSPSIKWSCIENVESYAFILEDIISHSFVHWFIPYISKDICQIDILDISKIGNNVKINNKIINIQNKNKEKIKIIQGLNSLGEFGYYGMCAPEYSGIHHYHFRIYGLDKVMKENIIQVSGSEEFERKLEDQNIKIISFDEKIFQYSYKDYFIM